MLLLIAAVYACVELRGLFPKGSDPREALKTWHFMLGLAVFVLAWLRLGLHFFGPVPGIEQEPSRWVKLSASLMHVALYMLMIGLPLLGWLILSASGKTGAVLRPATARARRREQGSGGIVQGDP